MDPSTVLTRWKQLRPLPAGRRIFSRAVGRMAPYTGTMGALVLDLEPGRAKVELKDRHRVRNHLESIHAIALMNLGELATGLATLTALPKGSRGIIVELGMRYLKKARGTITAEARASLPAGSGDHDVHVEASLLDEKGDEVAHASAVWRVQVP